MSGKLAIEAELEPSSSDSTSGPHSHAVVVALSPHGALRLEEADGDVALDPGNTSWLAQAFARGAGDGLLALALAGDKSFSPDLAFWRDYASRFVAARCQSEAGKTPRPEPDDLAALIEEAPPMRGGEYLAVRDDPAGPAFPLHGGQPPPL